MARELRRRLRARERDRIDAKSIHPDSDDPIVAHPSSPPGRRVCTQRPATKQAISLRFGDKSAAIDDTTL